MQTILLALAFLLELIAFISFAAISYVLNLANNLKLALFVILLMALVVFWSFFMAPKASRKFRTVPYYVSKALIYTISAITLCSLHGMLTGGVFVALVLLDETMLFKHHTDKTR